MTRDYSSLDIDSSSNVRGDEIPLLTYENAGELITDCDHVVLSIETLRAKRPYNHDIVDTEGRTQRPARVVTTNRTSHIIHAIERELESILSSDNPVGVSANDYVTVKLEPESPHDFERIETMLYDMVPYWEHATLNYAWVTHQHPVGSTLQYENTDRLVPHPDTKAFAVVAETNNWSRDTEQDMEREYEAKWNAYEIDEDNPRFTYGPTRVLNGDYGMAGVDIAAVLNDERTPVMFDVGSHNDTLDFPSENDPSTPHNSDTSYSDVCRDAETRVGIEQVRNHMHEAVETHPECPNPVITPTPEHGLKNSFS